MDNFKAYTIGLVALVVSIYIVLVLACFYLEPPSGDTTRISGYSENDFGWNLPQKVFKKDPNPLTESYDHYVDVLVVGDSFSFGGLLSMMNYPWQSYLTNDTGLTVATISHYTTKTSPPSYDPLIIPQIVNSETFKKSPPKVFVLEVVERQLNILPKIAGDCKVNNKKSNVRLHIEANPSSKTYQQIDLFRNKVRPPFKQRIPYAVKYLETWLPWNREQTQSYVFDLTESRLFSNQNSSKLLVYEGDVKKKNWNSGLIDDIKCRLINIQNLVQTDGNTLFVLMIAPDKLTTYSPFLKDSTIAKYSVIDRLATEESLHFLRLDIDLQQAIRNGVVDIYLPNDTHWASQGQRIGAKTLENYIHSILED